MSIIIFSTFSLYTEFPIFKGLKRLRGQTPQVLCFISIRNSKSFKNYILRTRSLHQQYSSCARTINNDLFDPVNE